MTRHRRSVSAIEGGLYCEMIIAVVGCRETVRARFFAGFGGTASIDAGADGGALDRWWWWGRGLLTDPVAGERVRCVGAGTGPFDLSSGGAIIRFVSVVAFGFGVSGGMYPAGHFRLMFVKMSLQRSWYSNSASRNAPRSAIDSASESWMSPMRRRTSSLDSSYLMRWARSSSSTRKSSRFCFCILDRVAS